MKVHVNKTKIIATFGPACKELQVMEEMVSGGVDVFRFNMSHGTHEDHLAGFKKVRLMNKEHNLNIAILADLQGPKIRIGKVRDNMEVLEKEQIIEITNQECISTFKKIFINYQALPQEVE